MKTVITLFVFILGARPRKPFSKSTGGTFIALANRKQGQSYTFESSTTLVFPVLVFTFVFKGRTSDSLSKTLLFVFGSSKVDNGF